jgi:hypothetical protein
MPIVEDSLDIMGRPDQLFALSQDTGLRLKWDPFPQTIELLGGATKPGVGVRVTGRSRYGVPMEVVFVSFNPPRTVAMKMVRGPWYFRGFAGTWLFQASGPDRTRVTFRYWFALRGLLLRWLLTPLVVWRIHRDVRSRLQGLKRGAEELGLLRLVEQSPEPAASADPPQQRP